jgi:hypothetical protein
VCAIPALEIKCLTPLSRYPLVSLRARVAIAETSDPAFGSVSAKAASLSPFASGGK